MGWKLRVGLCPLLGRRSWTPSNTMSLGPRPTSLPSGILIHRAIWPQQIWVENWGLCQNWGLCPFGEGTGSPCNTMWPGPRASFTLIHPTVWPQCTNVTDRTDIASRQRLRSARRCLLTVPRHRRSTLGRRAISQSPDPLSGICSQTNSETPTVLSYIPTVTEDILLQPVLAGCSALEVLRLCTI